MNIITQENQRDFWESALQSSAKYDTKHSTKFIDLFAGIGGFRIALEKEGFKCVFSSELNQHCQKVYANNFKDKPNGDITKINPIDIPKFEILVGGFPCQLFSKQCNYSY